MFLGVLTAGYFFIAQIVEKKTQNNTDVYKPVQTEVNQKVVDFTVGGKPPAGGLDTLETPKKPEKKTADTMLEVPYVNEAPSGFFGGPWKNACEEASIAMAQAYYTGKKTISINEAETFMKMLFDQQDTAYGSNANSDAARTAEIINKYTSFGAVVKNYPTLDEIKKEIKEGRPVITPNYGFGLQNPDIPFLGTGSSYHMEVIIGYNDETREFITNDSGDVKNGAGHRYGYELFMNTVRDYDYATNIVNGPMRAIFTFSR